MKNGGQAFPNNKPRLEMTPDGGLRGLKGETTPGMTLRDYFAAAIMNGMLCRDVDMPEDPAKVAYSIADAMIKERDK